VSGRRALAVLAVCGLLAAGRSGAAATRDQPPGTTEAQLQTEPATPPVRAGGPSREVAATYAQREHAAKNLERFEGGGRGVYIGGSTLVVVLLIVLIIVLI
jgi:hypothetical protein